MGVADLIVRGAGGKGGGGAQEASDTLRSTQRAEVLDLLSEGPIVGLVNGLKSIYLNDVPIENADGSRNFQILDVGLRVGTQGQTALMGFDKAQAEVGVGVRVTALAPVVRSIPAGTADKVRITFGIPQLSTMDTSNGNLSGAEVAVIVDVQAAGGGYVQTYSRSITGKTMSRYQWAAEIPLTGTGPWDVRVRRPTADSASSAINNQTWWDSYTLVNSTRLRYPNSAVAGVRVNAEVFQSIPTRTYDAMGLIISVPSNYNPITRVYTGTWNGTFKQAWTNNPAWVFYDLATHRRYGLGKSVDPSMLNKWDLYRIAQYCDQLVSNGRGGTEPRFTANLYLQQRGDALAVLRDLAALFRGLMAWTGGQIMVVQDAPDSAVSLFARANVIDGRFRYESTSRKLKKSGCVVWWNNLANLGKSEPLYHQDPDLVKKYGVENMTLRPLGITSEAMALRLAKWALYTEEHEGETVTFSVGDEGALVPPGRVFKVADPSVAGERLGGRLVSSTLSQIVLDAPVTLRAGETYTVWVQTDDPADSNALVPCERGITNGAGTTSVLNLSTALPRAAIAQSVWVLSSDQVEATTWRCIGIPENKDGTYSIVGIRHDPTKYAWIEQGLKIESKPVSRINLKVPAPTSVAITETTSHDSQTWSISAVVSWVPGASGLQHRVQWRQGKGTWKALPLTTGQAVDLVDLSGGTLEVLVRSVNALGTESPEVGATATLGGPTQSATAPTGFVLTIEAGGVVAKWDASPDFDYVGTELYVGASIAAGSLIATVNGTRHAWGWPASATYTLWARHTRRSGPKSVPVSSTITVAGAAALTNVLANQIGMDQLVDQAIGLTKFANGLRPVEVVTTLPSIGNTEGRTVYLTTDRKLYTYRSGAWSKEVDGNDLKADSVTSGAIAAGAVKADEIDSKAVTTGKLLVTGNGAALNPDPGCIDPTAWTFGQHGSMVEFMTGLTDGRSGANSLRATNAGKSAQSARPVEVATSGKTYRLSVLVRRSSIANGTFYLRLAVFNSAGVETSQYMVGVEGVAPGTTWTRYTADVPAPPSAWVAPRVILNWGGTQGWMECQDVRLEEKIDADLIVDGAIRARHVGANEITADKIDSRGLVIRDAAGVVILGSGVDLDWSRVSWSQKPVKFDVRSRGFSATSSPWGGGLFKDGVNIYGGSRSYILHVIRLSDAGVIHAQFYDVHGSGALAEGRGAASLAADLDWHYNNNHGTAVVVVYGDDEPQANRMTSGLAEAMYRHGASPGVFGSDRFRSRGAYILVGVSGCGMGNGVEVYKGEADSATNSWAAVSFSIAGGALQVVGGGSQPVIDSTNVSTYIASAALGTAQIVDAAITRAKIGDLAVNTLKIADNAVSTFNLVDVVAPSGPTLNAWVYATYYFYARKGASYTFLVNAFVGNGAAGGDESATFWMTDHTGTYGPTPSYSGNNGFASRMLTRSGYIAGGSETADSLYSVTFRANIVNMDSSSGGLSANFVGALFIRYK